MTTIPPIREYLLLRLSETERERMESLLFESDAFFDQVHAEEESLLDEYLLGDMSPADRRSFEQRLALSTELQDRLLLRRTFLAALGPPKGIAKAESYRSARWLPMAASAAAGALAASLLFTVILIERQRTPQKAEMQTQPSENSSHANLALGETPGAIIFLPALETRSESAPSVFHLSRKSSMTEIQVQLPSQSGLRPSLRMTLRRNNQIVFQLSGLTPKSVSSVVYVSGYLPTEALIPGAYQVEITSDIQPHESIVRPFEIQNTP